MSAEGLTEADLERLDRAARETLARCGNCAQATFAVLEEEFDLDGATILRALTPFPGIALRGETCGAVVGSLMAIGLVYGRDDLEDWPGYIGSLRPARRFTHRFEVLNESTDCMHILEAKLDRTFDLADADQAREYVESGGPAVCAEVIAGSVRIASEIISSERGGRRSSGQAKPAA